MSEHGFTPRRPTDTIIENSLRDRPLRRAHRLASRSAGHIVLRPPHGELLAVLLAFVEIACHYEPPICAGGENVLGPVRCSRNSSYIALALFRATASALVLLCH